MGGYQLMLILVLLGIYFDAVVIFVTSQTLLFRLALAILCRCITSKTLSMKVQSSKRNLHIKHQKQK